MGMKITGLKIALPGVAFACGIAVFSCAHHLQNGSDSGIVKIEETRILLTGVPISAPDEKALEKILRRYDRSLYKIDVYKNGRLTKTLGLLDQSVLDQVTAAKVAEKAKRPGFSGWGDQIAGTTTGSTTHPTPTPLNERPAQEMAATTTGSTTHPTPRPHNERPAEEMAATTTGSTTHPTPRPHRDMSDAQEELLRRVKPILEKYTHK